MGADSQHLGYVSCFHGPTHVHTVCKYWAPGSCSAGQPVVLPLKHFEMGVTSMALRPGCSKRFFLGWLPLLLASLNRSSGTTSPLPPDGRDTAVRTHWWHTTPFSCPSTLFDPCPQSLQMPWRKHGIRLSVFPEQDDDVHCPLTCGVKPAEQTCGTCEQQAVSRVTLQSQPSL